MAIREGLVECINRQSYEIAELQSQMNESTDSSAGNSLMILAIRQRLLDAENLMTGINNKIVDVESVLLIKDNRGIYMYAFERMKMWYLILFFI